MLLLGDSFTEGLGLPFEESFAGRLAARLAERDVEVLNAGVVSYSPSIHHRKTQHLIEDRAVLASFMPMVALLGGNSGAQSLAVVIRAMAVGSLPPGRATRAVRREAIIGLINGVVIAILSGLLGGVVAGDAGIGFVIGIAVFANLVAAGIAGASIPIMLRRMGLDPALASNIFLTTVTDIVGFGGFLLTAKLILGL